MSRYTLILLRIARVVQIDGASLIALSRAATTKATTRAIYQLVISFPTCPFLLLALIEREDKQTLRDIIKNNIPGIY